MVVHVRNALSYYIPASHRGDAEGQILLECHAVWAGKYLSVFRGIKQSEGEDTMNFRNLLLPIGYIF
jgi:hypothetical protein